MNRAFSDSTFVGLIDSKKLCFFFFFLAPPVSLELDEDPDDDVAVELEDWVVLVLELECLVVGLLSNLPESLAQLLTDNERPSCFDVDTYFEDGHRIGDFVLTELPLCDSFDTPVLLGVRGSCLAPK